MAFVTSLLVIRPSDINICSFKQFQGIAVNLHLAKFVQTNVNRKSHVVGSLDISIQTNIENPSSERRSGNYHPNIWDNDFVQSLTSKYKAEVYTIRAEKLKKEVKGIFNEASGSASSALKLVDTIQRLGLNYHFQDEIKGALNTIISMKDNDILEEKGTMYLKALRFRLLRQHGYEVSQGILKNFKEELMRSAVESRASTVEEIETMLSLYEASFHSFEGEEILDEVQEFTTKHLNMVLEEKESTPNYLTKQVIHSLEVPLHWRLPRVESRWYIDTYKDMKDMNPLLLELAILDFNMVQATQQEELKYLSRWWKESGLAEANSYARDRLVECFFWVIGFNFDPNYGSWRRHMTKIITLIIIMDDMYDVYGFLDELELFTDAVERWDITKNEKLPDYMKTFYLFLYHIINEMSYEILLKRGHNALPYLKRTWTDLCKAYLEEAKWYYTGHTPTLEEYMSNAWKSISFPLLAYHAYFLLEDEITQKTLDCLNEFYPAFMSSASMVSRLSDDLATSKDELERGDVPKAIQCYMHQSGVSENDAREYIKNLIKVFWKKMNKDMNAARLIAPQSFIDYLQNNIRTSQCFYQYRDGFGVNPHCEIKDLITSIIVNPIE